mmetsp:Transcript_30588/g.35664  ORF Transcript_30588/g.35664 Transcript_30588/m.35664 type:complete len:240 (+) Transcript_30588:141-860(+)
MASTSTSSPISEEENVSNIIGSQEKENSFTDTGRDVNDTSTVSALQDNIESKGKNAYYFAHAHKATGPKWDGKPEPRLLAKHSSSGNDVTSNLVVDTEDLHISNISNDADSLLKSLRQSKSSFDFKSNITKYAFLDEGKKVKIYIDLKGVGEQCANEDDIKLDWDESSLSLQVFNYNDVSDKETQADKVRCLSFGRLHGFILKATFKLKTDRIILVLFKKVEEGKDPEEWPAVAQKVED